MSGPDIIVSSESGEHGLAIARFERLVDTLENTFGDGTDAKEQRLLLNNADVRVSALLDWLENNMIIVGGTRLPVTLRYFQYVSNDEPHEWINSASVNLLTLPMRPSIIMTTLKNNGDPRVGFLLGYTHRVDPLSALIFEQRCELKLSEGGSFVSEIEIRCWRAISSKNEFLSSVSGESPMLDCDADLFCTVIGQSLKLVQ